VLGGTTFSPSWVWLKFCSGRGKAVSGRIFVNLPGYKSRADKAIDRGNPFVASWNELGDQGEYTPECPLKNWFSHRLNVNVQGEVTYESSGHRGTTLPHGGKERRKAKRN